MLYSLPGKAWPKHYKTKMVLELCFRFPSVSTAHFDSFTIKFTKKKLYIYIYMRQRTTRRHKTSAYIPDIHKKKQNRTGDEK